MFFWGRGNVELLDVKLTGLSDHLQKPFLKRAGGIVMGDLVPIEHLIGGLVEQFAVVGD